MRKLTFLLVVFLELVNLDKNVYVCLANRKFLFRKVAFFCTINITLHLPHVVFVSLLQTMQLDTVDIFFPFFLFLKIYISIRSKKTKRLDLFLHKVDRWIETKTTEIKTMEQTQLIDEIKVLIKSEMNTFKSKINDGMKAIKSEISEIKNEVLGLKIKWLY